MASRLGAENGCVTRTVFPFYKMVAKYLCYYVFYVKAQARIPYIYLLALEKNIGKKGCRILCIHYIRPVMKNRLRWSKLELQSDDDTCDTLVNVLNSMMKANQRPTHLVAFINPNSGKRTAEKIFKNKVLPLLRLCNIGCNAYVTQYPKQAREKLQIINLQHVDGILTVGGDGLFCEVVNGLILRTQKDNGIDVDDNNQKILSTPLPIGIIPAGSGDIMAQYINGVRDEETSMLKVVLGKTIPSNVASIHQGGKLSAYAGILLAVGLQGDMMKDCEKYRWMGVSRYNVIPIGTVLMRRPFHVEVEYKDEATDEINRVSDVMYSVDTYVADKDTNGRRIKHVFGQDTLALHMTSKCSLNKHIQQLSKLKNNNSGTFDYDFIHTARVKSYTVRFPTASSLNNTKQPGVMNGSHYVSCDGEAIQVSHPELHVTLHQHVITLFGDVTS